MIEDQLVATLRKAADDLERVTKEKNTTDREVLSWLMKRIKARAAKIESGRAYKIYFESLCRGIHNDVIECEGWLNYGVEPEFYKGKKEHVDTLT